MNIPIEGKRLKDVRNDLGLTQAEMAQRLNCGSSTVDMERGRTKVNATTVMTLLKDYKINPLWLFGESPKKYLDPEHKDVSPRTISLDEDGKENILLVNAKAAAGYADNLSDPNYLQDLPAFNLPIPEYRNATYRVFQVEGDSMLPLIAPGEWLITQAVESLNDVINEKIYVVVEQDGIRVKKVIKDDKSQQLILISSNADYPTASIDYTHIQELWEFHSKITRELNESLPSNSLDRLAQDIAEIKAMIKGR